MALRLVSDPARVWDFCQRLGAGAPITAGMKGLGLERDGELIAGALFENYTVQNICMHVAATSPVALRPHWVRRVLAYPFQELGCRRVTAVVASPNTRARRLVQGLGFRLEAVLKEAAPEGDFLVYVLWRKDCRYVDPQ